MCCDYLCLAVLPEVNISAIDPVLPGGNLVLTCSATGDTPLIYMWTMAGEKKVMNADNSTGKFTINNLQKKQFGIYTCKVSNNLGSGASNITVQQASECCSREFSLSFYNIVCCIDIIPAPYMTIRLIY